MTQLWNRRAPTAIYSTRYGRAFHGDALDVIRKMSDESVDLILTSPPYPLLRKKRYGNPSPDQYSVWFMRFASEFYRILRPRGSFVLEVPDGWVRGMPVKSLFLYDLVLSLARTFYLAQEIYWYNSAKLPTPAQWVTVERMRLKESVTPIWWFSKSPRPKADNRNVLLKYSRSMEDLLRRGYNEGARPSGHVISRKWKRNHGGAIPPNLIVSANTDSGSWFLKECRRRKLVIHPARFSEAVPRFFIQLVTKPGDLVLDPFAGSNTVGWIAEGLHRRWIAIDLDKGYVRASKLRFHGAPEPKKTNRDASVHAAIEEKDGRRRVGTK